MEWRPAGWSVCLPLLISPCTIKSRNSSGTPGWSWKKDRKTVVVWWYGSYAISASPTSKVLVEASRVPVYHLMLMYSQLTSISTQPRGRPAIVFSSDVSSMWQHSIRGTPLKKLCKCVHHNKPLRMVKNDESQNVGNYHRWWMKKGQGQCHGLRRYGDWRHVATGCNALV